MVARLCATYLGTNTQKMRKEKKDDSITIFVAATLTHSMMAFWVCVCTLMLGLGLPCPPLSAGDRCGRPRLVDPCRPGSGNPVPHGDRRTGACHGERVTMAKATRVAVSTMNSGPNIKFLVTINHPIEPFLVDGQKAKEGGSPAAAGCHWQDWRTYSA